MGRRETGADGQGANKGKERIRGNREKLILLLDHAPIHYKDRYLFAVINIIESLSMKSGNKIMK